ncbi:PAS domain-containing sensor histidine kinase [Seonamhaeicola sp. ML3]|uniref:PAS domain-containing sensor histidine kinase n=1 Tax=Seonamhaeicola sp. ML3 TaxID=2937786 RepID=UPI00200FF414|nr:PAS domain-containing sensor histidine kinase [Seonamhaeicola sp. ML3]
MDQEKIEILERALKRERAARRDAERILEEKSAELYSANQRLEKSYTELEALLDKTDSQLQGVFENIVDAYVIIDLMGNILKMNDAAVDLLGFDNTKENANLLEFPPYEEKERVSRSFKNLLKNGAITDFQVKIITKKGEEKLVHINASIILDQGIPVAAQGIVRDITEAKAAERLLRESDNRLKALMMNLKNGVLLKDENKRIILANEKFCELFGIDYNPEKIKGQYLTFRDDRFKNLFKNPQEFVDRLELIETAGEHVLSDEIHMVNGKILERDYIPIYQGDNYRGHLWTYRDITDLKNLEHQKEKLLSQLEYSNEELQEYAHIVSHDLKSPLRSINALVSWLKTDNEDKFDKVSLQNLALIETTIEKMDNLISDVLEYSSIGSDSKEYVQVDLNSLINDLIQFLYKPDHVSVEVLSQLPIVNGDKTKLQQLFQNLMSNAIKFIDKAEGFVKIDVEDIGSHYKFSIKDNGIGIDEKYHSKIFKVFQSVNKRKDSTGIGLSIVQKIVELHDGEIWLDSKLNEGTTFFFTLKK